MAQNLEFEGKILETFLNPPQRPKEGAIRIFYHVIKARGSRLACAEVDEMRRMNGRYNGFKTGDVMAGRAGVLDIEILPTADFMYRFVFDERGIDWRVVNSLLEEDRPLKEKARHSNS